MVSFKRIEDDDFVQCASCLKSNEETDLYLIEVGKTRNATSSTKLCRHCANALCEQITKEITK